MVYALLKSVHLLSVIVWLGGMFFTLFCLRPAAMQLAPPVRIPLMQDILARFFTAVAVVAILALASGAAMIAHVARATRMTGAPFNMPLEWTIMSGLGVLMLLIFGHIRMALFKRVQRAAAAQDWPAAGAAMKAIRDWVAVNLVIGTLIVVVTMVGALS